MKTSEELIKEIVLAVKPPRGTHIEIVERSDAKQNWVAAGGPMDPERTHRFWATVAALDKSDPLIDWSSTTEHVGDKSRVARWLSEVASN